MEAIGRLASGIAHDFNNVLGGIIAYGEMLFDEAPDDAPRKRYAQNVLTAATRGRELVDQILAFTRSQRGKRRPIDVSPHRGGDARARPQLAAAIDYAAPGHSGRAAASSWATPRSCTRS